MRLFRKLQTKKAIDKKYDNYYNQYLRRFPNEFTGLLLVKIPKILNPNQLTND